MSESTIIKTKLNYLTEAPSYRYSSDICTSNNIFNHDISTEYRKLSNEWTPYPYNYYFTNMPFKDAGGGLKYVNTDSFINQLRSNMISHGWNIPATCDKIEDDLVFGVENNKTGGINGVSYHINNINDVNDSKSENTSINIKISGRKKYVASGKSIAYDLDITISDENRSEKSISNDKRSEKSISDENRSEKSISNDKRSEKSISDENRSEKSISNDKRSVDMSGNWLSKISNEDMKMITRLYSKLSNIKISDVDHFKLFDNLENYTTGVKLPQWPNVKIIIQRWILPWTEYSRSKLYTAISEYTKMNGMITLYINRLNKMREELFNLVKQQDKSNEYILKANNLLSEAALTSGGIAFYGSIGLSLMETYKVCNVDHLFYFTSLYMLTDYWFDDPSLKDVDKISTAKTLIDLIENPRLVKGNPVLTLMTDILLRLIKEVPNSYDILKNAFYSEIVSTMIQGQDDLPADVYLKVCEWKGGAMLNSMQVICGSKPDKSCYIVGACIQLIDDMHDIDEDMEDGINTIATHINKKYGNLDCLFFYMINLLTKLDKKHTLFKPFMLGMIMHSIAIIPHFSKELHDVCEPFFPFEKNYDLRGVIYDRMMRVMRSN